MSEVYIAGVGFTPMKIRGKESFGDLVYDAVTSALEDSGFSIQEIDTVMDAGIDLLDGKGISNTEILASAGCYLKEEAKVEEDGLVAVFYAEKRIKSGLSKNVLIFGYSKSSCLDIDAYFNAAFDPTLYRQLGFTEKLLLALQSSAIMNRIKVSPNSVLDALLTNSLRNPFIEHRERGEEVVIYPLREKDLPLYVDGAVALVLTDNAERVKEPVRLLSSWIAVESGSLSLREPGELPSFKVSLKKCLEKCGLKPADIDVWELSEPTPYHLMMMVEDGGICRVEDLQEQIKAGRINPSGGALLSTALVACGLYRLAFGSLYLRENKLPFSPPDVKRVLCHGYGGVGMQSNTVVVIEKA